MIQQVVLYVLFSIMVLGSILVLGLGVYACITLYRDWKSGFRSKYDWFPE